jgi:glycosyltransferase involved in cell wall biosynthesis
MKILFLSFWFPYPPNNGSRIRIYNFLKSLAIRHDVFLVSLLQEDSNPEDAAKLSDFCTVVSLHNSKRFNPRTPKSLLGFFSSRPRSIVDSYDPVVKSAVQKAINQVKPDVIIVSTLGVVEYVLENLNTPSVLIDHNCEYAVLKRNAEFMSGALKRWRFELGWKKFARWEAKICQKFSAVLMPTEDDKRHMLEFAPHLTNIHVIPNGADTDYFDPMCWSPETDRLMYNGALTYIANFDAIEYYASEIYPLLKLNRPRVQLMVTGHTHSGDVQTINNWPGIELTGYVDDIRDVLYKSAACVVPLRKGGGMRLKIPEAMAAGVPVVSTSMGAEGLDCIPDKHLLIADTPQDFATAIERVLTDVELAKSLRQNARELIERRYNWNNLGDQFVSLVEQVAAGSPPHT